MSTQQSLIEKLPWEKILIWALFLSLVYVLRHFFLIIFMTFITSYLMRNLILFLSARMGGKGKSVLREQLITILCFLALLASMYGLGRYFVPRLVSQGQALVQKLGSLDEGPRVKLDSILRRTVGHWLLMQKFGEAGSPSYEAGLQQYLSVSPRLYEYDEFGRYAVRLSQAFERDFLTRFSITTGENGAVFSIRPLTRQAKLDRDQQSILVKNLKERNPQEYWRLFSQFYERLSPHSPLKRYSLETVLALLHSHKGDIESFGKVYSDTVLSLLPPAQRAVEDRKSFEFFEARNLVAEWKQGAMAEKIGAEIEKVLLKGIGGVGNYVGQLLPLLVTLPVQLFLSLLLSFFITYDIPKMSLGLARLKTSRISHFYEEIAPSLANFGKLIGRAFQAQGVIALVNTLLTFGVISVLGIQNELFLSAIVFFCSFIPVLGVVLSGAPIAAMAIIQDGGGLILALWAVVGILVVHFIETSVLNPKIVGTFLHLHPVLVLAILALGEHFFGVWGLLLGVPVMVYVIRFVILNEGLPWEKSVSSS